MNNTKHTPTPWHFRKSEYARIVVGATHSIGSRNTDNLAFCCEANADLIVRAVNCHDELLAFAKATFHYFDKKHNGCHDPLWHLAKEIIAKAEPVAPVAS